MNAKMNKLHLREPSAAKRDTRMVRTGPTCIGIDTWRPPITQKALHTQYEKPNHLKISTPLRTRAYAHRQTVNQTRNSFTFPFSTSASPPKMVSSPLKQTEGDFFSGTSASNCRLHWKFMAHFRQAASVFSRLVGPFESLVFTG